MEARHGGKNEWVDTTQLLRWPVQFFGQLPLGARCVGEKVYWGRKQSPDFPPAEQNRRRDRLTSHERELGT